MVKHIHSGLAYMHACLLAKCIFGVQGLYTLQNASQGRSPQQPESSSEAKAEPASFEKGLKAHFSRRRGGFYCVMHCEGQVLRTNLAPGHPYPVWRHEASFKSVQISSDLKVSPMLSTNVSTSSTTLAIECAIHDQV